MFASSRVLLAPLVLCCGVVSPARLAAQTPADEWALRLTAFGGVPILGARAALQVPNGWYAFADASRWYRGWGPCPAVVPSECHGDGPMFMAGLGRGLRAFFVEGFAGAYHYSGSGWVNPVIVDDPLPPGFQGVPPESYFGIGAGAGLRADIWLGIGAEIGLRLVFPFGDDEYRAAFGRRNTVGALSAGISYRLPLR